MVNQTKETYIGQVNTKRHHAGKAHHYLAIQISVDPLKERLMHLYMDWVLYFLNGIRIVESML